MSREAELLAALRGARALILEMGHVIRHLDEDCQHLELWTNDGEYIACDGRHDAVVAALSARSAIGEAP